MRGPLLALLALVAFTCVPAQGKCPLLYVELEGEVVGESAGEADSISIEIEPDSRARMDPVVLEEGRFTANVPFNTTESAGRFDHDCSRKPSTVEVVLISNGNEASRIRLSIEDDFMLDEEGDYRLIRPVSITKPE